MHWSMRAQTRQLAVLLFIGTKNQNLPNTGAKLLGLSKVCFARVGGMPTWEKNNDSMKD